MHHMPHIVRKKEDSITSPTSQNCAHAVDFMMQHLFEVDILLLHDVVSMSGSYYQSCPPHCSVKVVHHIVLELVKLPVNSADRLCLTC